MKKIISIFIFLLLLVGCSLSNSPTSKVEDLLTKYQTLDKDIVLLKKRILLVFRKIDIKRLLKSNIRT